MVSVTVSTDKKMRRKKAPLLTRFKRSIKSSIFPKRNPKKAKPTKEKVIVANTKAPISEQLAVLSDKVDGVDKKLDAMGKSVSKIHDNTIPQVGWIPSLIFWALIVWPVQSIIIESAPEYQVSAWLSGFLQDADQFTSNFAISMGVESVGGSVAFVAPLKGELVVTSHFDLKRSYPVPGSDFRKIKPHKGTDYRCKVGDGVYAMRAGIVTEAGFKGAAGNMIILTHSNGDRSIYMHLNRIKIRYMQKVSTGQRIGDCGGTGKRKNGKSSVTGPHLHLAIYDAKGKLINPVTVVAKASSADMWQYFRDTVAQSESQGAGGYMARTPSGTFNGKYQMGRRALRDVGYGNVSWDKFLKSPEMQEDAYRKWQARNLLAGRHGIDFETKSGTRMKVAGFITDKTPAYKIAGYLHACQFGAYNALKWYVENVEFRDGNQVRISEYARRGEVAFRSKYGRFANGAAMLKAIEH